MTRQLQRDRSGTALWHIVGVLFLAGAVVLCTVALVDIWAQGATLVRSVFGGFV